ncbi:cation:proton antiporter [Rhodococcus antarcticus]|uniref:Cation:proton antiporter n=1 Tax=Rhodococcus antarcticus TaxID=2987751 RepID=A0ABY6P3N6_9NOCA|nr:cation:proton antiporter [Rhodococcus antarcticus]UZJ26267.1 cation:proton antiporter [Rhodococcus antarcticus]
MGTDDITGFGLVVLLVSGALVLALLANRLSAVLRVPAPAMFLVGAAIASDVWPALGDLTERLDERIVTVALIVVLFDGGMGIGWRRFRRATGAVLWIGIAGTVVTAAGLAAAAHLLFGFDWRVALLLGTALAPTDPAVVFSVLGGREITGRTGTILEGESGANDPVGIAILVAILGATGGGVGAVLSGVGDFALQMSVGLAVGVVGGLGLRWVTQHVQLPNEGLYPLRTLTGAAAIYGLAAVAHGSGFLAVFLAGILVGDTQGPYKAEIERFTSALASLAEIVAFTILGLTVSVTNLFSGSDLLVGLALAGLMILLVRPVLVGLLLIPVKLSRNERIFVLWAGLKGAVPILLGIFLLNANINDGARVYRIIFVVVLVSVVVQGGSVPAVARLLRIPMRAQPPEPYAIGLRLRQAPEGLLRYTVEHGAPADGALVSDLDLGPGAWLSLAARDGELVDLGADTRLRADDEVLLHGQGGVEVAPLFTVPRRGSEPGPGHG